MTLAERSRARVLNLVLSHASQFLLVFFVDFLRLCYCHLFSFPRFSCLGLYHIIMDLEMDPMAGASSPDPGYMKRFKVSETIPAKYRGKRFSLYVCGML